MASYCCVHTSMLILYFIKPQRSMYIFGHIPISALCILQVKGKLR